MRTPGAASAKAISSVKLIMRLTRTPEGKSTLNSVTVGPATQPTTCAMMLKLDFGLASEAEAIERAVNGVLEDGWRTFDIKENDKPYIGTAEMGRLIADCIK